MDINIQIRTPQKYSFIWINGRYMLFGFFKIYVYWYFV